MLGSILNKHDGFKENNNSKLKLSNETQFSIFHDYLGLINIVQPSLLSPLDSPMESPKMEFSFDYRINRQRINSLDSDGVSESSSSGSGSESEALLDSLGSQSPNDYLSYKVNPSENIAAQSYAQTLESLIAKQSTLQRLASTNFVKDNRSTKTSNSKATVCVFCRNNGESREFYSSHTLKDNDGNTTCPILRAYTCPLCKANGDQSHTIKYCPKYTPKLRADKLLELAL